MAYSKPMVTIELSEYNELKRLVEISKHNESLKLAEVTSAVLSLFLFYEGLSYFKRDAEIKRYLDEVGYMMAIITDLGRKSHVIRKK